MNNCYMSLILIVVCTFAQLKGIPIAIISGMLVDGVWRPEAEMTTVFLCLLGLALAVPLIVSLSLLKRSHFPASLVSGCEDAF